MKEFFDLVSSQEPGPLSQLAVFAGGKLLLAVSIHGLGQGVGVLPGTPNPPGGRGSASPLLLRPTVCNKAH